MTASTNPIDLDGVRFWSVALLKRVHHHSTDREFLALQVSPCFGADQKGALWFGSSQSSLFRHPTLENHLSFSQKHIFFQIHPAQRLVRLRSKAFEFGEFMTEWFAWYGKPLSALDKICLVWSDSGDWRSRLDRQITGPLVQHLKPWNQITVLTFFGIFINNFPKLIAWSLAPIDIFNSVSEKVLMQQNGYCGEWTPATDSPCSGAHVARTLRWRIFWQVQLSGW